MTNKERWNEAYQEVMRFMNENARRPSKHRIEEHRMLNWMKFNHRQYVRGEMPDERREPFEVLLLKAMQLRHKNQYDYPDIVITRQPKSKDGQTEGNGRNTSETDHLQIILNL